MIKRTETYRSDENGFLDDADVAGFLKRSHRRERYLAERDTAKGTFLTDRIDGVRKERETDLSEILAGRWEKTEIRKVLYESLKELDPKDLELVKMIYFDGLTLTEAAEKLERAVSTISTRKKRILKQLKNKLTGKRPELFSGYDN